MANKKIILFALIILIILVIVVLAILYLNLPAKTKDKFCSDGTKKNSCSNNKPFFCNKNLELVEDCEKCGCIEGYKCEDKKCMIKEKEEEKDGVEKPPELDLKGLRFGNKVTGLLNKEKDDKEGVSSRKEYIDRISDLGSDYVIMRVMWHEIEKTDDNYNFSLIDEFLDEISNTDINPIFIVKAGEAEWATSPNNEKLNYCNEKGERLEIIGEKGGTKGEGKNSFPPKDINQYKEFLGNLVDRVKNKVKIFAIENEPGGCFFMGDVDQYSELLKSASEAVKRSCPECKISIEAGHHMVTRLQSEDYPIRFGLPDLKETNALRYVDIIGFHCNNRPKGCDIEQLAKVTNIASQFNLPVWNTESGESPQIKAIETPKRAAFAFANGASAYFDSDSENILEDHPKNEHYREDAYQSYKLLIQKIQGSEFVSSRDNIYRFKKDNKDIFIAWSDSPQSINFCNEIQGQVLITNIDSNTEIKDCSQIQLSNEPIYLESP